MKKYMLILCMFSEIVFSSQSIRLSEYFFAPKHTITILQSRKNLMEIKYNTIHILPIGKTLYICQTMEIKKKLIQTFTLCTDAGTYYIILKKGKKVSQGKISYEPNSNSLQANGVFCDNENCKVYLSNKKVAGLDRDIIEFRCNKEDYSFAFGLGLFQYNSFIITKQTVERSPK